ncbi:Hypothetical predicted protein [Lecanosticta acicola]|uniref:Uncharacterized protein n=1 Tax=Lecanosticta acicola TaxID=111012 RepID=A0AAI8Z971_9PEZI|nr:Hypothetical predicted protein [Lecanosticta acicola]
MDWKTALTADLQTLHEISHRARASHVDPSNSGGGQQTPLFIDTPPPQKTKERSTATPLPIPTTSAPAEAVLASFRSLPPATHYEHPAHQVLRSTAHKLQALLELYLQAYEGEDLDKAEELRRRLHWAVGEGGK